MLFVVAALFAAGPALAQQAVARLPSVGPAVAGPGGQARPIRNAGNDDDDSQGNGVAGLPGFPGRGLAIDGQIITRYDNNLSRQPIKDDGVRIRPSIDVSYGLGAGRLGVYGIANFGRDFIYGNQRLAGRNRHLFGGGVNARLAACTLDVGLSVRRNLVFETDVAVFGGQEQNSRLYGANANCGIGSALGVSLGVLRGEVNVVRGATAAFDSNRMTYSAGVRFARPALGVISLDGGLTDAALIGRKVLTPDGLVDDGIRQRTLRLGYARAFGSRINLSAGASYIYSEPALPFNVVIVDGVAQVVDREGFTGGGYDVQLNVRPTARLSLVAGANRSIRGNNFVGARMILADTIELEGSYRLGRALNLSLSYRQRKNSVRGAVVTAFEPVRRDADTFRRYSARINADLGRFLDLALEVNHNRRISNPAAFSFDATGVGLVLGFKFGKQGV